MSSELMYRIAVGDVCSDWGTGLPAVTRNKMLKKFREEIADQLGTVSTPWELDLEALRVADPVVSLHNFPTAKHLTWLTSWLAPFNAVRDPAEQLYPKVVAYDRVTPLCCAFFEGNWRRCQAFEITTGSTSGTAVPWKITVAADGLTDYVPVLLEVWWDCKMTNDGWPLMVATAPSMMAAGMAMSASTDGAAVAPKELQPLARRTKANAPKAKALKKKAPRSRKR